MPGTHFIPILHNNQIWGDSFFYRFEIRLKYSVIIPDAEIVQVALALYHCTFKSYVNEEYPVQPPSTASVSR